MKDKEGANRQPLYSERIVEAVRMAHELHGNQTRKGGEIPYITHLFGVAALVGEHGGDEDQFIAGILHDASEDQGGLAALARIQEAFGARVASLVEGASDTHETPKPPWKERKEAHIDKTREAAPELKLILAADKLHNMRSIRVDLHRIGPETWKKFKGDREGTLWYYRGMLDALRCGWDHPILAELEDTYAEVTGLARQAQ